MSDFFHPKLQAVEALAPYRLRTSWSTGEVLEVDIQSVLSSVPALANLLDPKIFAKAHLADWGHSVEWFDAELGADNVYAWAKEQAGEVSHQMFDTWMHRNGLSLKTAADALGISRRMVSYYRTAQKAIPRAIWLACLGWEITRPKTKALPHALPTAKEYASAHQGLFMRTTLSIDDDVLFAAKRIALREGRSLGEVVSDLVRGSLQASVRGDAEMTPLDAQLAALGLTPYRAPGVAVVTQAQIEAMRLDEGV